MQALTKLPARARADAVAAARAAVARGQACAYAGGGTDRLQHRKDGTNPADVLSNRRTVREAAASVGTPPLRHAATRAGNSPQRPWCWDERTGLPCFQTGGSHCGAAHGEPHHHAIFGAGPSGSVHPSALAPALVALGATCEVLGPDGPRHT
jgi:CO/xanthine dehydrogenase FAD-binding subunit